MRALSTAVLSVQLLALAACNSTTTLESREAPDIVRDSFPEAEAAIERELRAIADVAKRHDWEALRAHHLESPKFTKFGRESGRLGFEEMIASEIAGFSIMEDVSVDHRDLKIDVFGDVAVVTSFPLITGTLPDGTRMEAKLRATGVWVETTDGWKVAHEHNTRITDIVDDPFPEAQAAIRKEMMALNDIGRTRDLDALRAAHLQGPKFSEIGGSLERSGYEEMIEAEIAFVSSVQGGSVDFRDLEIDVFGDVAVTTSFPVFSWTEENGEAGGMQLCATMVYVKTADGWKIAHEHLSAPADTE